MPAPAQSPTEYFGYLFAYFTGNDEDGEALRFALSRDGYAFHALNGNRPVVDLRAVAESGGIRDPYITRAPDGKTFYMTLTDMASRKGWDSNRAMILMKSDDLTHWTSAGINIQRDYPGQEDLKRVWAPQTIYDPTVDKMMVYWSMQHGDAPDVIYYAYANAAFDGLEAEPKVLFRPKNGLSCIDGDIVFHNDLYHLFYVTTGDGFGIKIATAPTLTGGAWTESPDYKQHGGDPVEGSCAFRRFDDDSFVLMYDVYTKGRYEFLSTRDLVTFTPVARPVFMDFHPRHGSVMPVTREEWNRLQTAWGEPSAVAATPPVNPVLPDLYADPYIMYSKKTNRYYIYPTTDGFPDWGSDHFKAFSSDNLRDWQDEGVILRLGTDVTWAPRRAWAPTIIERSTPEGGFRYYFYFSADAKIGVATADDPAGPFVDSGKPLLDQWPDGVTCGQQIDADVFADPVSGKIFLYWGNAYLAVAELNEDMISLKPGTTRVITPDATFREGATVFQRNGLYYFLWSENDTGEEDYRVRYGTARSPYGPIEIPKDNIVIAKDPAQGIFGTGHNSILHDPNTDAWHIVYHRFQWPNAIHMGRNAAFHRETCIDAMEFAGNGRIIRVMPTQ